MGDIRIAIEQLKEPTKSISKILIEFYETMKRLETDAHKGGKQATKIVMTTSDIETLMRVGVVENFAHEPVKEPHTEALNKHNVSSCLGCALYEECYTRITRGVPPDYSCYTKPK